ncbi:MAG: helix-turn-helix domain-containing protein [Eubacterium sp.]|nr:helix-turn-helix domain-containing protein [Eubacterium sp.]
MFYNRFMELCGEYGEKPTPVLKKLDISPGNLRRWEGGASITAETLEKIANYFGVPVDYFFLKDEERALEEVQQNELAIKDDTNGIRQIYAVARIHPDYIASILSGRELTESELERVANYLRCKKVYLLNRNVAEEDNNVCKKSETDSSACLSDKELVIDILSRIPANKDYKYLQVMISRIIAENLKRNGIYQDDLIACGLARRKVADLFDSSTDNERILAFNNSDILRIVHCFRVGYDLVFTGV